MSAFPERGVFPPCGGDGRVTEPEGTGQSDKAPVLAFHIVAPGSELAELFRREQARAIKELWQWACAKGDTADLTSGSDRSRTERS